MDQSLLGVRLRAAREARGVSLRSVAAAIGVSPSLLSQIENGKTNPSVDTLYALVQQLDLSVDAMLGIGASSDHPLAGASGADDSPTGSVMQTLDETPVIEMENGVRWERLAVLPGQDVEALRVTYQPGASSSVEGRLMRHLGWEHLVIVSGELRVRFEGEEVVLHEGDSMAFDSRLPHLYINTADRPALGIWYVLGRRAQLAGAGTAGADRGGADADSAAGAANSMPNSAVDVLRHFRNS